MGKNFIRLMALATVLVFLAGLPATVLAATFSYYDGSLSSFVDTMVSYESGTDHPDSDYSSSPESTWSSQGAYTADELIGVWGYGTGKVSVANQEVVVYEKVFVSTVNDDYFGYYDDMSGYMWATSDTSTNGKGICFQLVPQAGENLGDPVRIDFHWRGESHTPFGVSAYMYGDGLNALMDITLNEYLTPNSFGPAKVVWTQNKHYYSGEGTQDGSWEDEGFFMAAIGDVIGINMGTEVDLYMDGVPDYYIGYGIQELSMEANSVPIPGAFWLLCSGLIGLAGLRKRLN